ncbi:MAG: hypothetical protein A3H69_04200 [Candidatus Sungbacteria bacterium RIFCSPLOWO2_02_FULL_47_9]|nr:MAG: hypothetical protein UX72_C0003G0076 [Parcubacteria group bacterium GW2011_GWA2_47_10]OHA11020.1 MAG: hypothetical protein A3H69_04200 [Candidatus Sungbacteria bacterium RIFCSPLOWO2_02_FULL_47_9]
MHRSNLPKGSYNMLTDQINILMTSKITLALAVVLVLVGGFLYMQMGSAPEYTADQTAPPATPPTAAVPAPGANTAVPMLATTGNPDDIVSQILTDSDAEAQALQEEANDASLVSSSDSQEMNDLGQTYDESQF